MNVSNLLPSATLAEQLRNFCSGGSIDAYTYLGAHPFTKSDVSGWMFRLWAPNAEDVSVVGSFNGWDPDAAPMALLACGVWECFIVGPRQYDTYKYSITTQDGNIIEKSDPMAFHAETPPGNASKLYDISGYSWNDHNWLQHRIRCDVSNRPINLYELHLGSWRRTGDGRLLSYRTIATYLVPYLKEMGYTGVELMPVSEHSDDKSLGYESTGYYAVTSRFGTPHDFMYLVNQLHEAGLCVMMDWLPGSFPKNDFGLYRFDGGSCYGVFDPDDDDEAVISSGICAFDFGKPEVHSFLSSAVRYWLQEYHIDGLRLDATRSSPVGYLRQLKRIIDTCCPGALLMAGSRSIDKDFQLAWDGDWANSIYRYLHQQDGRTPLELCHLAALAQPVPTFHRILPISHELLMQYHSSFISGLPGDDRLKFAIVRTFYLYMLMHPGKKLTMMGTEFGQFSAWRCDYSLDWHLLQFQPFQQQQQFFRTANHLYAENPPLWQLDYDPNGCRLLQPELLEQDVILLRRQDISGKSLLLAANFSTFLRQRVDLTVPSAGTYRVLLHTDDAAFGGSGRVNYGAVHAVRTSDGMRHTITIDLPPASALILSRCTGSTEVLPIKRKRR